MDKLLFDRSCKLLSDSVYKKIEDYPTFIHMKSHLNDAWYNFIVPKVETDMFDWGEAAKLILSEKENGVSVSYYVADKFLRGFQSRLGDYLGNDTYMYKSLTGKYEVRRGVGFSELDESNITSFKLIANECFPEWENNGIYTDIFYELANKKTKKIYKNVLMKFENHFTAIGCAVISKEQRLTYIHNMGTLEKHRRKGFFLEFVKHLCNVSLENGVGEVYALVEENGGSYNGLHKLGFEVMEKYHLFEPKK